MTLENRHQQFIFAAEVVVNQPGCHLGFSRQVFDADILKAPFSEQRQCNVKELLAARFGLQNRVVLAT